MFHAGRLMAFGAMIALAMPAAAQGETPRPAKKKGDPNEIVCEKQEVLGSRLAAKRVCMTRAEWDQQRQADRQLIDRSQLGPCVREAGC